MLINFSNHPYDKWTEGQKKAAKIYGSVIDLPFPAVPADADEEEIRLLAEESVNKITSLLNDSKEEKEESAVMVQGETTLTYSVVTRLLKRNIKAISACSERRMESHADEKGNITKTISFQFERFREYKLYSL